MTPRTNVRCGDRAMHYEVERLVGFFHPPTRVILSRDYTGHPRRFIIHDAAEKAARTWRQPGGKRIVQVGPDREREVVARC
jgi:hypothetical protein